jgi:hypothetical protein
MKHGFVENFVPDGLAKALAETLLHSDFPWYWRASSKYGLNNGAENSNDFQFVHIIYYNDQPQSDVFVLVQDLVIAFENATNIKIKNIHKIKANLLTRQTFDDESLAETIHSDIEHQDKKYVSVVYYVNDSDGNTVGFDENSNVLFDVCPKKTSAVYFDSGIQHRATPPSNNKRRVVLNMVFEVDG